MMSLELLLVNIRYPEGRQGPVLLLSCPPRVSGSKPVVGAMLKVRSTVFFVHRACFLPCGRHIDGPECFVPLVLAAMWHTYLPLAGVSHHRQGQNPGPDDVSQEVVPSWSMMA